MSTKSNIGADEPRPKSEQSEPSSCGVTTDELSRNAMGGTEMMKHALYDRLPVDIRDAVQVISSRVREVDGTRPTILWLQDLFNDPESRHLAVQESRNRFEKIVYVSSYQRTQYEMAYAIKPSEGVILRNCIEPFETATKSYDTIKLIYHTTPHRGLALLVYVFDELARHYPNIELDVYSSFKIYGWDARDAEYEHLFEKCRAHPRINYHGYQPNEVVREALKRAHIFSYPSIWPETSCISAIEAMSAGCAIVCPDFAALPETTGGFAISYPMHEDPNAHAQLFADRLAAAINSITSEDMKNRLSFQKAYADTFYDWHTRISQWEDLMRGVLRAWTP